MNYEGVPSNVQVKVSSGSKVKTYQSDATGSFVISQLDNFVSEDQLIIEIVNNPIYKDVAVTAVFPNMVESMQITVVKKTIELNLIIIIGVILGVAALMIISYETIRRLINKSKIKDVKLIKKVVAE